MISSIRQLRPLVDNQPWGIFFLDFKKRSLPIGALRKILSGLVFSKRRNTEHAVWDKSELLFICSLKYEDNLVIGFVHFKDSNSTVPSINTVYWDVNKETNFNFKYRLDNLAWPSDMSKTEEWKRNWSSAFTTVYRENIVQSRQLVEQLAELAQNTRQRVLETYLVENASGELHKLYKKFQELLIHDLSITDFADMYAQTVAYGLFSARCMDSDGHFELSEVVDRIPTTNPFLKQLLKNCFEHGLGSSKSLMFDELAIGEIVDLLDHIDTDKILDDFGRQTGGGSEDPVIHFYEGFLDAYEHEQKKRRGVYYTPDPVVSFIVRSVDEILRNEFGYADGLADVSTKTLEYQRESKKQKKGTQTKYVTDNKEVPAVQILDPATGTGTFLSHTIRQIKANFNHKHQRKSEDEIKELWNEYVPKHLLPRLNGFELMMAPYAVAHMKQAMVLKETGYDFTGDERVNVFLTNSLEEAGNALMQAALWEDPLATESIEANQAKKNKGINVVIGNPPYSVSSSNKGDWILHILEDYKKDLNERKLNLDDDYIKFIRLGQSIIEKAGAGIVAYISNNGFLDGVTYRQMRKSLLEVFDRIHIINLHGNSKKKESAPDGSKDDNVFDIQQGVSINIFVKYHRHPQKTAEVFYCDLFGERTYKYSELLNYMPLVKSMKALSPSDPYYFFVPKNFSFKDVYEQGFKLTDIFTIYNSGIQTKCDNIAVSFESELLKDNIDFIRTHSEMEIENHFGRKSSSGWSSKNAKRDALKNSKIQIPPYLYRPFDNRFVIYSENSSGLIGRPRISVMNHLLVENISLISCHFQTTFDFQHIFVTDKISDLNSISMQTGEQSFVFPLFIYEQTLQGTQRYPNLDPDIIHKVCDSLELPFKPKFGREKMDCFSPLDLIDYIYAVLHSPRYRKTYKEFLKIDFPRVPYPTNQELFWKLVEWGRKLRQLHLLEVTGLDNLITEYPIIGNNLVEKSVYVDGSVYINSTQHFSGVPQVAWEFYIGGYQPMKKWLKDRKGRALTEDDIMHYQKMIVALTETDRIMKEIDEEIEF
ncbi:MAG: N-6 DNA methylase, partial [Candidatus Cloacimonetes bacterium]|nr:N-6 DNA methylase [Candidatus Cloacimonadota bacterium]